MAEFGREPKLLSLEEARQRNFADPEFVAAYDLHRGEEVESRPLMTWGGATSFSNSPEELELQQAFYNDLRHAISVEIKPLHEHVVIHFGFPSTGAVRAVGLIASAFRSLVYGSRVVAPVRLIEAISHRNLLGVSRLSESSWNLSSDEQSMQKLLADIEK